MAQLLVAVLALGAWAALESGLLSPYAPAGSAAWGWTLFPLTPGLSAARLLLGLGALASVVAGLVDKPVIAVPTSVGYGANFGGLAALLTMLNSCASGVSVVNIDNGFGAGFLSSMINKLGDR
jgi:hypothetical protein